MNYFKYWIEAARLNTLPASLTPVFIASAFAHYNNGFQLLVFLYCLAFAILSQIGSNFANDYLDSKKGADTKERTGPRRLVSSGILSEKAMQTAAILVLASAFLIGLNLIEYGGYGLLIVGISSLFFAWCYTGGPYPLAYNALGDIFVVLFFGLIAVCVTFYVHTLGLNWLIFLNALACGLFTNNLLVINNIRDCEEDRVSGKRTTIVLFGKPFGRKLIAISCLFASAIPVINALVTESFLPLLGIIPPCLCWTQIKNILTEESKESLYKLLKNTGLNVFLYGILVSLGFFLN
jgi:1,4-dihydroxy-2-naphthoate octaprenyltransferase